MVGDGNGQACTRWCSFAGIGGLDRILRQTPTSDDDVLACSLPLSRGTCGTKWEPDPCNIVVFGAPGTGKSTLALDMAAEIRTVSTRATADGQGGDGAGPCAASKTAEPCTILYYGLEQSPESLERRFRMLARGQGGKKVAIPIIDVPSRDDGPSKWAKMYREGAAGALSANPPGMPNLVLFPRISPRPLEDTGEAPDGGADHTSIFWRRYAEVRHLIETLQEEESRASKTAAGLSPQVCCDAMPEKARALAWTEWAERLRQGSRLGLLGSLAGKISGHIQNAERAASEFLNLTDVGKALRDSLDTPLKQVREARREHEETMKLLDPVLERIGKANDGRPLDTATADGFRAAAQGLGKAHACLCAALGALAALWTSARTPRGGEPQCANPATRDALDRLGEEVASLRNDANGDMAPCLRYACGDVTIPPLRMVVIDSLSMLSDKPVTRYLVDQLFALFTEKNVVGLFVVEERGGALPDADGAPSVPSDVCFSADVVMRLSWAEWEGYAQRTIEVTKSRHSPNTYGRQWIKVRDCGIEVYPSLHNWYTYLHSVSPQQCAPADTAARKPREREPSDSPFGGMAPLGPDHAPTGKDAPPCRIALIAGPNDTYKASIAARYADKEEGAFLLVSFAECASLTEQATRHCETWFAARTAKDPETALVKRLELTPNKGEFGAVGSGANGKGYQLWLAPGYLLSEEVVWFVHERLAAINATQSGAIGRVNQVIFADVGHIPSRYPALSRQILDGTSNFFPVLRKLFEHHGVDGVFVCSTDDRRHNLLPLLKPMAHHCIELRYEEPNPEPEGSPASIHAVVSGCWVKGRRHVELDLDLRPKAGSTRGPKPSP